MATATATPAPAKPTVVTTPAKQRVSHFRAQNLAIRWHEDVHERLDLVSLLTSWAEKQGHIVQVRDLKRGEVVSGQSVRIGGSMREGGVTMTKATRELIKAAGFTPEQIEKIITEAAKANR